MIIRIGSLLISLLTLALVPACANFKDRDDIPEYPAAREKPKALKLDPLPNLLTLTQDEACSVLIEKIRAFHNQYLAGIDLSVGTCATSATGMHTVDFTLERQTKTLVFEIEWSYATRKDAKGKDAVTSTFSFKKKMDGILVAWDPTTEPYILHTNVGHLEPTLRQLASSIHR